MSVRQFLNDNPAVTSLVLCAVLTVCLGMIAYQLYDTGHGEEARGKLAYFSVDDGKSFFVDDAEKVSGFDHSGVPAYRAYVFRADSGEPFVGYLERFTPEVRNKIEQMPNKGRGADPSVLRPLIMQGQEIKKPGDLRWYKRSDPGAAAVIDIKAPDGASDSLQPVYP